jgi:AbiEi antitoxin C-terminal domain
MKPVPRGVDCARLDDYPFHGSRAHKRRTIHNERRLRREFMRHTRASLAPAIAPDTGRAVFSRDEAVRDLGSSPGAFLDAAERLQRRGRLVNARQGFYVVVPPQYLSWGAPPPSWYLDDLMRHEERPYYVGLLRAAELHRASHQAVMEFQMVTDKRMPELIVGRSKLAFYYRNNMAAVTAGIEDRKTETGRMKLPSAELTALDLLRYPRATGGIDHIATVLSDLGEKIDPKKLALTDPDHEHHRLEPRRSLGRHAPGRAGSDPRGEAFPPAGPAGSHRRGGRCRSSRASGRRLFRGGDLGKNVVRSN